MSVSNTRHSLTALAATATLSLAAAAAWTGAPATAAPAKKNPAGKVVGSFPADASAVSAGRGWVAVAVGADDDDRTLYVGHPGALGPAKGVGPLPSWALPHIGIDSSQKTSVFYPRCASDQASSCDLYRYDVLTGVERPLTQANSKGAELEAAMDHGRLVFSRLQPGKSSVNDARTLYYRAAKAKRAKKLTAKGGAGLAIQGTRVAQIRDADPTYGVCGYPTVEVIDAGTNKVTEIDHTGCGMNGQRFLSPAFIGNAVTWAYNSIDSRKLLRRDLTTRQLSAVNVHDAPIGFAPVGTSSGYALLRVEYVDASSENTPTTVQKFSKLRWVDVAHH